MTTHPPSSINSQPDRQEQPHDFREAGIALVRYMMRARLKQQPTAFSPEQLTRWKLANWQTDRRSVHSLLQRAYNTIIEINEKYLQRCASGGLEHDETDPYGEVKDKIAFFVDYLYAIPAALNACRSGGELDWENLARWEDIDQIRELLDQIPASAHVGRRGDAIMLQGDDRQPIVLGELMPIMSETEYALVGILLDAAPERLTINELGRLFAGQNDSDTGDLGRAIRNLAKKHDNWKKVLILPGRGRRDGYGVRTNSPN